jgi:hypothetical protein
MKKRCVMKKIIFIVSIVVSFTAYAQTYSELQPAWVKVTPIPPAGANYILNWGMGEGSNATEAYNHAWADALQKSLHDLGVVGITHQDIDAVAQKGIDAVVAFNKVRRHVICPTSYIPKEDRSTGKMYLLIQMQFDVSGKDDFNSVNADSICKDRKFDRALAAYMKRIDGGFTPRALVPGMAQIHKGSTLKGTLFIAGEAAMIGGVVLAENLRASYQAKINTTHNAANKKTYINKVDNWQNIRNGLIAGAAAVYVWNVIDGIVAKGKPPVNGWADHRLRIAPYVAPGAGGITLALNF